MSLDTVGEFLGVEVDAGTLPRGGAFNLRFGTIVTTVGTGTDVLLDLAMSVLVTLDAGELTPLVLAG